MGSQWGTQGRSIRHSWALHEAFIGHFEGIHILLARANGEQGECILCSRLDGPLDLDNARSGQDLAVAVSQDMPTASSRAETQALGGTIVTQAMVEALYSSPG